MLARRISLALIRTGVMLLIAPLAGVSLTGQSSTARTAWGDPDLQGTWVIVENAPLERPDPEDPSRLAALTRWFPGGSTGFGGLAGVNAPARAAVRGRAPLVVDPPEGRIPMLPAAAARRDYHLTHLTDSYEHHTLWERCLTRGPVLLPSLYNNGYQILQTPGYVAFVHEMIHEFRLVPLDGTPRGTSRRWLGAPRGWWEGDTLVIETTNYREGTILASSIQSVGLRGVPHSDALRTVERLRLRDENTLEYELLVEDPETYSRPWRVVFPVERQEQYRIYEYACHEGNYGLPNSLSGAREEEREETPEPRDGGRPQSPSPPGR
jgi:hypothetical protein